MNEFGHNLFFDEFNQMNLSLSRIKKLLEPLDNPHTKFEEVILVGGTNGKGSVATFLANILQNSKKTGLYLSPHFIDFYERIQINGKKIDANKFLELYEEVAGLERKKNIVLTPFERLTLIAFRYFYEEKTKIVVLEVGLGGRLDATNVTHPKISIITNIALDHTHLLGETREKIAYEKSYIIRKNRPVVT